MKSKGIEEILFAQRLGGNDVSIRIKSMKKLKTYFRVKSSNKGFSELTLLKIWKGLYYCMYMADKPLFQEELAEDIGRLIHSFATIDQKCLFFKVAMDTFAREWLGIDVFRMDKFMMLICRVLRQMLVCLKRRKWKESDVSSVVKILEESIITPLDQTNQKPMGLKIHLADIIMEELSKIGRENLSHETIMAFVYPYMKVLAISRQKNYVNHIKTSVFDCLIKQSKLGAENQEDMEYGEYELVLPTDNEEGGAQDDITSKNGNIEEELELDPRAGGVDVVLPELKPDYDKLSHALQALGSLPQVNTKKRKMIYGLVKNLREMSSGNYPFSIPIFEKTTKAISDTQVEQAMDRVKLFNSKGLMDVSGMSKKKSREVNMRNRVLKPEEITYVKPLPEAEPDSGNPDKLKKKGKREMVKTGKALTRKVKRKLQHKQNMIRSSKDMNVIVTKTLSGLAKDVGLTKSIAVCPDGNKSPSIKRKRKIKDESDDLSGEIKNKKKKLKNRDVDDSENVGNEVDGLETMKKKKKMRMEKSIKDGVSVSKVPKNKILNKKIKKSVVDTNLIENKVLAQNESNIKKQEGNNKGDLMAKSQTTFKISKTNNVKLMKKPKMKNKLKERNNTEQNSHEGSPNLNSKVYKNSPQETNEPSKFNKNKLNKNLKTIISKETEETSESTSKISNKNEETSESTSKISNKELEMSITNTQRPSKQVSPSSKSKKVASPNSPKIINGELNAHQNNSPKNSKPSGPVIKNQGSPTLKSKKIDRHDSPKTMNGDFNMQASNNPKNSKLTTPVLKMNKSDSPSMPILMNDDPFNEPMEDGEFEFEVLSNKTITARQKNKTPRVHKGAKKIFKTPPSHGRKLKINLKKNLEHEFKDYKRVLQNSPQIPFSTEKKPLSSVLKATNSPILIKKSLNAKLRRRTMGAMVL